MATLIVWVRWVMGTSFVSMLTFVVLLGLLISPALGVGLVAVLLWLSWIALVRCASVLI